MRDRDYLVDRHGVVFSVIGDAHPSSHYLGFAKYHPSDDGDRMLFGRRYRRNGSLARSFELLAHRPECLLNSSVLGCTMTAISRHDVVAHYSARAALRDIDRDRMAKLTVGRDLLAIADALVADDAIDHVGVTGSCLVGCPNDESDIDLVCYGDAGADTAHRLFADRRLIRPYSGSDFDRLCRQRARNLPGATWPTLLRRETRRLQGLTVSNGAHVNCEPLRADGERLHAAEAEGLGDVRVIAVVTEHEQALFTPAWYRIEVQQILTSIVGDAARIEFLRSYLGAYRGAFRKGERIRAFGQLLRLHPGDALAVELTDWTGTKSYGASLAE